MKRKCNRCGAPVDDGTKHCWFCHGVLCQQCWTEFGHCGHPLADQMEAAARFLIRLDEKQNDE